MVAAAEEPEADAIGMSGLLVKSTLIMRDNLEELNDAGLADIPVILGGAALTRTYVERDLREVYEGRLFYGKDAFEGLRTMDRLVELNRRRARTTRSSGDLGDGTWPAQERAAQAGRRAGRRAGRGPAHPLARGGHGQPDSSSRRSSAAGWPKGIPIDDIAAYLNETALFRNQWGFRPEGGEDDAAFKDRVRATLARAAGQGQGGRAARAPGGLGPLRGQRRRRTTSSSGRTRPGRRSGCDSPSRARRKEPWLCIATSSGRSTRANADWASFMVVTMGARVSRGGGAPVRGEPVPGLPATCTASASRWPRPWPSTGTTGSARSSGSPTRTARR